MRLLTCAAILSVAAACSICRGAGADDLPAGLEIRDYTGWSQSIYINATETPVQTVIVPAVGGRVVHFSLNGENILFENLAPEGKAMGDPRENMWLGGYQCDIGPVTRSLPAHFALLQSPERWTFKNAFAAHLMGAADTNVGVAIDKDFVLAPDTGDLGIMQRMRNIGSNDVSYCLRDRTLCKGGGFAFFPLNPKSRFRDGWSQLRHTEKKDVFDGENPTAPQVHIFEGILVAQGTGDVADIGADSAAGWIAYVRGKLLFVKYFPCIPGGNYSDGGNTVEVYIDQRAVELSPLSPETKLAPGQEYSFPEKWVLIQLPREVNTWEEARRLARKIPASPFRP